jgi:hypothetical protein
MKSAVRLGRECIDRAHESDAVAIWLLIAVSNLASARLSDKRSRGRASAFDESLDYWA